MKASFRVFSLVTILFFAVSQIAAQDIPRLSNERPDFSGIWQIINEANYDLEPHIARHSLQMREGPVNPVPAMHTLRLGAVGAVPGSMGVIWQTGLIGTQRLSAICQACHELLICRCHSRLCRARKTYLLRTSLLAQCATSIWIILGHHRWILGWVGL